MMLQNKVSGIVQEGHQIASGLAVDSPYGAGSIQLQIPYFLVHGLDLSAYYPGTINLSIAPQSFRIRQPWRQISDLEWTCHHPPETFSFCQIDIEFETDRYAGLIYYPHPETKITHFQNESILELLAPEILGLKYGDRLSISFNPTELELIDAKI